MNALERAIDVAGSSAALAEAIGVSPSAPGMWKQRKRVPAEHCLLIERETGVTCEELRPDLAWSVLRNPKRRASDRRGSKPQAVKGA